MRSRTLLGGDRALLKLDIDEGEARPKLHVIMRRLRRAGYTPVWLSETRSPSGRGWHLVIDVRPRPTHPSQVVALQAILGSDPDREACNLARANVLGTMSGYARDRWNVLYKSRNSSRSS